jgi:hypothetical protein
VVATGVPELLPTGGVGLLSSGCAVEGREHEVLVAAVLVVEAKEQPSADRDLCEAYICAEKCVENRVQVICT